MKTAKDVHIIYIDGAITSNTELEFTNLLQQTVRKETKDIYIEMNKVPSITSSAMGAILNAIVQHNKKDLEIYLYKPTSAVTDLIRVLNLGKVIKVKERIS